MKTLETGWSWRQDGCGLSRLECVKTKTIPNALAFLPLLTFRHWLAKFHKAMLRWLMETTKAEELHCNTFMNEMYYQLGQTAKNWNSHKILSVTESRQTALLMSEQPRSPRWGGCCRGWVQQPVICQCWTVCACVCVRMIRTVLYM